MSDLQSSVHMWISSPQDIVNHEKKKIKIAILGT